METLSKGLAQRVGSYRIARQGLRGSIIRLPKSWADDLDLQNGDFVSIYKDGQGRLIVAKGNAPTVTTHDGALGIKFRNYRTTRRDGTVCISIPKLWLDEVQYVPGEPIDIFRDHESRLILTRSGVPA